MTYVIRCFLNVYNKWCDAGLVNYRDRNFILRNNDIIIPITYIDSDILSFTDINDAYHFVFQMEPLFASVAGKSRLMVEESLLSSRPTYDFTTAETVKNKAKNKAKNKKKDKK